MSGVICYCGKQLQPEGQWQMVILCLFLLNGQVQKYIWNETIIYLPWLNYAHEYVLPVIIVCYIQYTNQMLHMCNWDLAFLFKKDAIYTSMVNTNISAYIYKEGDKVWE